MANQTVFRGYLGKDSRCSENTVAKRDTAPPPPHALFAEPLAAFHGTPHTTQQETHRSPETILVS